MRLLAALVLALVASNACGPQVDHDPDELLRRPQSLAPACMLDGVPLEDAVQDVNEGLGRTVLFVGNDCPLDMDLTTVPVLEASEDTACGPHPPGGRIRGCLIRGTSPVVWLLPGWDWYTLRHELEHVIGCEHSDNRWGCRHMPPRGESS